LISPDNRQVALSLINEATRSGARLQRACEALSISVSTYRRWHAGNVVDLRKGAEKNIPRKLTQEEEQEILRLCNSQKYKDYNPYEIHASLLDEGIYIASVSSFYRILRKVDLMQPRRNVRGSSRNNRPPEKEATGPNQVWTWDITWLKTLAGPEGPTLINTVVTKLPPSIRLRSLLVAHVSFVCYVEIVTFTQLRTFSDISLISRYSSSSTGA